MNNKYITGSLALVFLWSGCSGPKIIDSSSLQALPGRGIANIVELGMPFTLVKENVGELVAEKAHLSSPSEGGRPAYYLFEADVPSLGIHLSGWEYKPAKVCSITLHVDPNTDGPRFVGSMGDLSFAVRHNVVREDVIRQFGKPSRDLGVPPGYTNLHAFVYAGESVSAWYPDNTERITYPSDGVTFYLEDNIVRRIIINWKVEQAGPAYPPQGVGSADP